MSTRALIPWDAARPTCFPPTHAHLNPIGGCRMDKKKKIDWMENIVLTLMCILTPVMALYFGTVMVMALIPTVSMLWALVRCIGVMVGTLFALIMELSPMLAFFAIPMLIGLSSEWTNNNR